METQVLESGSLQGEGPSSIVVGEGEDGCMQRQVGLWIW